MTTYLIDDREFETPIYGPFADLKTTGKSVNQVTDPVEKALADDLPPASRVAATQEPGLARALLAVWRAHASGIDMTALTAACGRSEALGPVLDALQPDVLGERQTAALMPRLAHCVRLGFEEGAKPLRAAGVRFAKAEKYSPDQPRDDHGRFGSGGSHGEESRQEIGPALEVVGASAFDFTTLGNRRFMFDTAKDSFIFGRVYAEPDIAQQSHAEEHEAARNQYGDKVVSKYDLYVKGWVYAPTDNLPHGSIEIYSASGAYLHGGAGAEHGDDARQQNDAALFDGIAKTVQSFIAAGATKDTEVLGLNRILQGHDLREPLGDAFPSFFGKHGKGGAGSGNFGHEGRPGEVGGSGTGGGIAEILGLHVTTDAAEIGGQNELGKIITESAWTKDTAGYDAAVSGMKNAWKALAEDEPETATFLKEHVTFGFMNNDAFGQAVTATARDGSSNKAVLLFNTKESPDDVLTKAVESQVTIGSKMAATTLKNGGTREAATRVLYQAMTDHELGHAVDYFHKQTVGGAGPTAALGARIHELMIEEGHAGGGLANADYRVGWVGRTLSTYAATGGGKEAWAEAYQASRAGRLFPPLRAVVAEQSKVFVYKPADLSSKGVESEDMPMSAEFVEWLNRQPDDWIEVDGPIDDTEEKGGSGSGNFGHAGRPGEVGGSGAGGGASEGGQTSTPEFKAWFKDSKVVDEHGEPLVVYHGSPVDFGPEFDPEATWTSSLGASGGLGVFFTTNTDEASHYAGDNGQVIPAYLSIQNPKTIERYTPEWDQALNSKHDAVALRHELEKQGYDGAITPLGEWVAFKATQIKSASGNAGTFNQTDPNITRDAVVSKPFSGYADFDDCVSRNQDKDDPRAFCGWLMHRVEGKATSQAVLDLNLFNPEAIAFAEAHAAELVATDAATKARIRALILQSQRDGIAPDKLARLLREVISLSDPQTEAVANFQQRLIVAGVAEDVIERRVSRFADAKLRERAMLISRTECLPAETLVNGAVVRAAFRRWYDGPMVEIVCRSGRKLSATPNHPMLSRRGWIPAGQITERDHLICDLRDEYASASSDPNVAARPSTIGEIFSSLQDVVALERSVGHHDDFHGDGQEREINTLHPGRILRIGRFSPLYKQFAQHILSDADAAATPYCLSCGRLLSVDQQPCLCDGAYSPALFSDAPFDRAQRNAVFNREIRPALSVGISRRNESGRERCNQSAGTTSALEEQLSCFAPTSNRYAALFDLVGDPSGVGFNLSSDESDAQSALIEFDRVVNVRFRPFLGHVFNLSTPYGYFAINGVYTGNTISALNAGQQILWEKAVDAGVIHEDQFWKGVIVAGDERTCDLCLENEAADEVPIDGEFPSGDEYPPFHPACRCSISLNNREEKAFHGREKGGAGSGNFGHAGRPGEVGGSGEGGATDTSGQLFYHGTSAAIARRIQTEGLKRGDDGLAFAAKNEQTALIYAIQHSKGQDRVAVVTLSGDANGLLSGNNGVSSSGSVWSESDIPAEHIREVRIYRLADVVDMEWRRQPGLPEPYLTLPKPKAFDGDGDIYVAILLDAEESADDEKTSDDATVEYARAIVDALKYSVDQPRDVPPGFTPSPALSDTPRTKYSPDQPRVPAGSPDSGQFGSGSGGGSSSTTSEGSTAASEKWLAVHPQGNAAVHAVASDYLVAAGLPALKNYAAQSLSEAEGTAIANAYEKAVDDPTNAATVASYAVFHSELDAQKSALTAAGYTLEPWEQTGQPYKDSKEMRADVADNKHLYYFKTTEGTTPNGLTTTSQNDTFRAVHDVFGHAMAGNQFGPKGETNAFLDHYQMFTPKARLALATESLAQNAWFNFSTENAGKAVTERRFADQKATLVGADLYASLVARLYASGAKSVKAESESDDDYYFSCPGHRIEDVQTDTETKGGAGSGNFGHAGRPGEVGGSGGGLSAAGSATIQTLIERLKNPDGGITIDTQTGVEHGKPGEYAVSIEGPQVVLDAGTLTPNDLAKFIATNSALLSSGHGDYFGAWHDPVDHKVYLDVSHIETSREASAAIARANHQIAYFDFAAMHSVDVEARKGRHAWTSI